MSNLSDREWVVLDALWQTGGATLGELTIALREETGWSRFLFHIVVFKLFQ